MSYTERACAIDLSLQSLLQRYSRTYLDTRDWRWHLTSTFSQRLQKYMFTAVHTKMHRRRFQIYPLWRAFSNLCVYGELFHRLRVDGRPKRIKKFAFTIVLVWRGPEFNALAEIFECAWSCDTPDILNYHVVGLLTLTIRNLCYCKSFL